MRLRNIRASFHRSLFPAIKRYTGLWVIAVVLYAPFELSVAIGQTTTQNPSASSSFGTWTNITSVPSHGDGHNYLQDFDATINPANGALSIRIKVDRPDDRGMKYPQYAFMYDSDQDHSIIMKQVEQECTEMPGAFTGDTGFGLPQCVAAVVQPALYDTATFNDASGASSTSVNTGPNTFAYKQQLTYNFPVTNDMDAICQINTGFIYEDFNGVKHDLGLLNIMNVHSNDMSGTPDGICDQYFGIQAVLTGGDATVKSEINSESPAEMNNIGEEGYLRPIITDGVGNNLLALEDANGNIGSGTGRPGYYPEINNISMPGNSGLGTLESGTSTITFPGISTPYTYTASSIPMTYQIGYTDVTPVGETLCGGRWDTNASNVKQYTTTAPPIHLIKYTSIELPNGLSYNLQYDPVYGLISKIIYPTGAWIEYTWGTNPDSEMIGWTDPPAGVNGSQNVDPEIGTSGQPSTGGGNPPSTTYCYFHHDFPAIQKRVISYDGVNPAQEQDFTYTTIWSQNPTSWTSKTTTVTTIDLVRPGHPSFRTVYSYTAAVTSPSTLSHNVTSGIPQENTITYYDTSGALLKTIKKVWEAPSDHARLTGECEILPSGIVSGTFYQYEPYATTGWNNAWFYLTDNYSDVSEYDYGILDASCTKPNSTPSRETVTTYASFSSTPALPSFTVTQGDNIAVYSPANMWSKPSNISIYDHGTLVSETHFAYDELALASAGDVLNHDDNHYGSSATTARGNLTTVHRYCFLPSNNQSCNDLVMHAQYDMTGQPVNVTDANGNITYLSYADNYTTDDGSPSGATNAYVTQITRPVTNGVSHVSKYQYDFNKGLLRTAVDENSQSTSYSYNDPFNRITETDFPDGGRKTVTYNDPGPTPSVVNTTLMNLTGMTSTTTTTMDGIGHVIQIQDNSDPFGADYVDSAYDGLELLYTITNPYRTAEDLTYGITTETYDALGEKTLQKQPDGSILQWCYNNIPSSGQTNCHSHISSATGTWVDADDENGNDWQRTTNGLGQLVAVDEPNGASQAPSMETDYAYDALNDVLSVTQNGTSGSTPRIRSFTYDSLAQLLSATNPESGQVSYAYDANGNILTKTSPAVNELSGTQTIGYCYDKLNRLVGKWSAAQPSGCSSTPTSTSSSLLAAYTFDTSTISGATNTIGRLVDEKSYINGTFVSEDSPYLYDAMGRLQTEQQCPITPCAAPYTFHNTYDLAGNLTSSDNGLSTSSSLSGNTIALGFSYDAVGRLQQATVNSQPSAWTGNSAYPTTLFQANSQTQSLLATSSIPAPYDPMGHMVLAQLGLSDTSASAAVNMTRTYDPRARLTSEVDGGTLEATASTGVVVVSGSETSAPNEVATPGRGTILFSGTDQRICIPGTFSTDSTTAATATTPNLTCPQSEYVYDSGVVTVTIGTWVTSVNYAAQTPVAPSLASLLETTLNADTSSPVTATVSGAVVTLTSKTTSGYPVEVTIASSDPSDFPTPSFSASVSRGGITGGIDGGTLYDAGVATVTISSDTTSYTATTNWGQGSTASTLASGLASAINSAAGSLVSATASGNVVLLISTATGTETNYSVSVSTSDSMTASYPTLFPSPSFQLSGANMSGGTGTGLSEGTVYSYSAGYDLVGNVHSVTDSVTGAWTYSYDTLNRLTQAQASSGPYLDETGCWTYDAFGNRTMEAFSTVTSTPCASGANDNRQLTIAAYKANNQFNSASYNYDAAGDVTLDPNNSYYYDAEGRLCATGNNAAGGWSYTQYVYDAEGRRVAKGAVPTLSCNAPTSGNGFTAQSFYLLGQSGEQVAEINGSGALQHSNVWVGGKLLGTYDFVNGGLHFALTDPLGTKRVQISGLGKPELNCLSLPFGNDLGNLRQTNCIFPLGSAGTGADATEHHFTGKERDAESGLDYFGARYYASSMGRWMSPDWAANPEAVPYSKLDNPQSLNLYQYVLNNPLSQKDDDGHEIIYADGLKNSQLVRDSVTAILANPNTSSYLSGYVGPNAPNLTIQSGDLGPPTVTTLPNGQTLTTTVQGNTAPDIQTSTMTDNNGVKTSETTLTGATITIDNNTSKGDTPGVMIHESVHAGEAQANPAKFSADAKAERGQPHDSRPQEQRANGVRAANEKQIKQQIKQIEKDRKKDQQ